ncbi:MAG: hypothetical protein EKK59_03335 [Neisseriaceae bacterium]|nr:MAG: hypothetical protein EKK59_03335 [Neisseriaceae bacterium]
MSDPTPQPTGNSATPPTPEAPASPAAATPPTLTQEQVNAIIADERRKWKQQQDAIATKARQEAEEAAAASRGEFEKLASERAARIAQLETEHTTAAEQLAAYQSEMERQVKARLRALPEEIRAMAPDGDALTRFAWLEKAEAAAAKLIAVVPTNGTPAGPRGVGTAVAGATDTDLLAKKRAQMLGR